MPSPFIRDMRAGSRLQAFLVSGIAAVLFLRLYLTIAGYPTLGGARIHIAHMLPGGLMMLAAIVLLLAFTGKRAAQLAAVIGGIGFGTFIDEVGKFVTRDNDYFFRPAAAIIYVIFVLLYLAIRRILAMGAYSKREYLVNALVQMEEVAQHDLDEAERARIQGLLDQSDAEQPLASALRQSLVSAPLVPSHRPSLLQRVTRWIAERYRRVAESPHFAAAVLTVFAVDLFIKMIYAVFLVMFVGLGWRTFLTSGLALESTGRAATLSIVEVMQIGSWLLSAFFFLRGVYRMRRSRLEAFRQLEASLLVSIFITQVFSFYKDQFLALLGLSVSILLLVSVRFMMRQERERVPAIRYAATA